MTRSTITREESIQAVFDLKVGYTLGLADIEILKRVARMALATLASEPVAEVYQPQNAGICAPLGPSIRMLCPLGPGEKLYRHAQPAPVVPDAATAIRACLSEFPESARDIVEECADIAENACRAAMLQASPVCTCPSGDGSLRWPCPVHPGNSPAQSDCCPAQNSVNPAQGGNYLVIPDEMTSEQAYEIGYYYGDPVDVFARGANWMRQHIIDSTLAAAPQSPGSEPATVPGKWIPVSERMPERGDYLVTDGCDFDVQLFNGEQFIPGFVWEDKITHWMPLPAAPQEVKGE